MALLYRWRAAKLEVDSTCSWAALHVLVFGMVAASFRGRIRLGEAFRAHWAVAVPLAAACVTHLYRLLDVSLKRNKCWRNFANVNITSKVTESKFMTNFWMRPPAAMTKKVRTGNGRISIAARYK